MKITKKWSQLPDRYAQEKDRVFETDKGFLIISVTDETDDSAVEKFKELLSPHAEKLDKCESQREVYTYLKLIDSLLKKSGIIDT